MNANLSKILGLTCLLTGSLLTLNPAHAGEVVRLENAEAIVTAAHAAFPKATHYMGNSFGRELDVQSLKCLSNEDEDECSVLTYEGEEITVHSDSGPEAAAKISTLWRALEDGGAKSEYRKYGENLQVKVLELKKFNATYLEPKPSSPDDTVSVAWEASYELEPQM